MSSTRTAKDDSVFHQGRYASNPEFERGLLGNMVAKRAALLDRREDRELLWAVHFLSHQDGGLSAVARDLLARYPDLIGTPAMLKSGKNAAQNFSGDEIREIRMELPTQLRRRFMLRGDTVSYIKAISDSKFDRQARRLAESARRARQLEEMAEEGLYRSGMIDDGRQAELAEQDARKSEELKNLPSSYPVAMLRQLCQRAAVEVMPEPSASDCRETHNLERELAEMCLDPEWDFAAGGPWYFRNLIETLRDYLAAWTAEKTNGAETKLGRIIADEFDYVHHSRCLSLLEGEARRGKSFAARMCCLKNPGKARFVEVPPGNDDTSFYRALARGLGLGNFLRYKTLDIRDRVESVLKTGDLVLVLDESQRLWPQCNQRYAKPARIDWLMSMANETNDHPRVPILMISTPQFIAAQKSAEKTGWNSAQLTGRISIYKSLPADLDAADLMAVCRAMLPEADEMVLLGLATYARKSARYLASVESIAQRALYLAQRAGRDKCTTADVSVAMKESIIPSDTCLNSALEMTHAESSRRRLPAMSAPESPDESPVTVTMSAPRNDASHVSPDAAPRRANLTEFAAA